MEREGRREENAKKSGELTQGALCVKESLWLSQLALLMHFVASFWSREEVIQKTKFRATTEVKKGWTLGGASP